MKVQAPNGAFLEFPDDITDAELEDFFNTQWKGLNIAEEAGAPGISFDPEDPRVRAELQRAETLRTQGPSGIMGPVNPEEVLLPGRLIGAGAGLAGQVLEPIHEAASDLTRDFMRQWGITPPPEGGGLIRAEEAEQLFPITKYTIGGQLLRRFAPEAAKGIDVGTAQSIEGATEPGTLALLPAGAFPEGLAYFAGSIASSIPESIRALMEAEGTEAKLREGVKLGGTLGMGGLVGRGLLHKLPQIRERTTYATQEGRIAEGRQPEYPGAEEVRLPAETGRGDRLEPAAGLEKEAQVLLTEALESNRRAGLPAELEEFQNFGELDKGNDRPFKAVPATRLPDGTIQPGRIQLSRDAFNLWWEQTDPAVRAEALRVTVAEEGIHAHGTVDQAIRYADTLTNFERRLGQRVYLGERTMEELGLNETQIAQELLRQRMQQLMRMDPTEIAEAAGRERWSRQSLMMMMNIVRSIRERIGTKAAREGQRITKDLLDRAEANIMVALKELPPPGAAPEAEPTGEPAEYTPPDFGTDVEAPFTIRRQKELMDFARRVPEMEPDEFMRLGASFNRMNLELGKNATPEQLSELRELKVKADARAKAAIEAYSAEQNPQTQAELQSAMVMPQFFNEAIAMAERGEALPQPDPGTVRLYHGEGGPKGGGFGTTWFTKDWSRAASFGEKVSYVDVPESVASKARDTVQKRGIGTSSDHVLPAEWAKQARDLPDRLQPRVYDVEGPAAIRRVQQEREQALPMGNASVSPGPGLVTIAPSTVRRLKHGTGAEVDRFSTEKVGTGEGTQVYGWGLYFAESQEVAASYSRRLTPREPPLNEAQRIALNTFMDFGSVPQVLDYLKTLERGSEGEIYRRAAQELIAMENAGRLPKGNLYTVDLDANPTEFLRWDKEIPDHVIDKIGEALGRAKELSEELISRAGSLKPTGQQVYAALSKMLGGPTEASFFLDSVGIKGIRYLDEWSRSLRDDYIWSSADFEADLYGQRNLRIYEPSDWDPFYRVVADLGPAGSGKAFKTRADAEAYIKQVKNEFSQRQPPKRPFKPTFNYVVFDDSIIKITHRNGEPVNFKDAVRQMSLELEPAAVRRKKAGQAEPDLPMPGLAGAWQGKLSQPEKTSAVAAMAQAQQALHEPVTPRGLSDLASSVLENVRPERKVKATGEALTGVKLDVVSKGPIPDFEEFVRQARSRFGDLQPGQLRDVWQESVWQHLERASGAELSDMAIDLGLAKQLKLEDASGNLKAVPDAAPGLPKEGTQLAKIPGLTVPQFSILGRPLAAPEQGPSGQPVYGPMAPFQPSRGAKALSAARFTAAQRLRARVVAAIGESLITKSEGGRKFLSRKSVQPEDVGDPRMEPKQPVYQEFNTGDQSDPLLERVLTEDARAFGGESTTRVIGGQKVTVRKKGFPVSATKRLTAIQHKENGKTWLVSTFRDGRRGAVLLDPMAPSPIHIPLKSILGRFRVISSVLLDEPVKDFKQAYGTLREFQNEFGRPARTAVERAEGYEPPATEEFVPRGTPYDLTKPVTPEEAASIMDHILGEVGVFDSEFDVLLDIEALRRNPNGEVISGYSKIANRIQEKNPEWTTQQVIFELGRRIYENHKAAQTLEEFQRRTISEGPPGAGEDVGTRVPPERKTISGAREIAIKRTHGPTWEPNLPKGPGPTPTLPEPTPPEMLSPRDLRSLKRRLGIEELKSEKAAEEKAIRDLQKMKRQKPPAPEGPASIRRVAKDSAKLVDKVAVEPIRLYSEWMNDRLRRVGGPKSQLLADVVDIVIQGERNLYGKLTPTLDVARKEAGKPNRATAWLHGKKNVTEDAAIANVVGAIEDTILVPAWAQPLVDLAKAANLEIGKLYERANPKFTATGKFQRNLTAYGFDIIRSGSGEAWEKLAMGNAVANRMPIADVKAFLTHWKEVLDESGPTTEAIERVNQDFQRRFPRAITHIKHAYQWQPILHADLFNYLETAARRATHVASFRDIFPPTDVGRKAFADLLREVRAETPGWYHDDLTGLMRALQGHPTDNFTNLLLVRPGQPIAEAARFVNQTLGNLMAKLVLTGQMFVQPGENIAGSTPVFLGYRNYLEGMARLRQLYPELELRGSVNRAIMDFSFDPTSSVRSVFRILGNTTGKIFGEHLLNELQEASAAASAAVVVERIKGGTLSNWERSMLPQTFRAMGFTPPQVAEMMRGNPELLQRFENRAAAFLTAGNKAIAEGSRLGSNRLFGSIFRFQSYPMMKMNQFKNVLGQTIDAWQSGTAAEKSASTRLLSRFLFGAAVQGALTVGITSLFYEGFAGSNIRKEEAKDEPFRFMVESMLSTMSGPFYLAWRGTRDKGLRGLAEQATRMIFPFQIMREIYDFTGGMGPYRDLSVFDRIAKFVKMKIPGTKAIRQGLALAGLSQDNPELDAAISAFYRWQRKELGLPGRPPEMRQDDRKEFRKAIRRAIEAMKDGDVKAYEKAMDEAYGLETEKGQTKRSIRAKTILKGPGGRSLTEEELIALQKRIGVRAVNLLRDFDAMVEVAK